jgi:MarR-like DNA-binding transcriptional regulator SgrR of sgrS sRNA
VEIQECRSTRTWKRQIEENVRQITKQSTEARKLTWQAGYGRRRASQIHHKTNTTAKSKPNTNANEKKKQGYFDLSR